MKQFDAMRKILTQIEVERLRQISQESYSTVHDDRHKDGALALAAAAYLGAALRANQLAEQDDVEELVAVAPWSIGRFKTPRNSLIKAAALIVAELERLDRLE